MANEQVEIHDPFTDHNHLKGSEDDDDAEDMGDTVEFRLLMAYAKRRRVNKESPGKNGNRTPSPQTPPAETEKTDDEKTTTTTTKKKKKKKKGLKRLMNIFTCIKPQTRDEEEEPEPRSSSSPLHDVVLRCGGGLIRQEDGAGKEEEEEEKELDDAAKSLMKIADQIPFVPPDLETDAPNDDVERLIGLLLRETGDRLNEKELKDLSLAKELFWNYAFFKRIITTLLTRMGMRTSDPDSPGPHASPKTQIAVACEATSRLSAMDTQPMNRLLGYGSRYLKEYYSSWAQEHGGYDAALESDDEEEEDDDVQ